MGSMKLQEDYTTKCLACGQEKCDCYEQGLEVSKNSQIAAALGSAKFAGSATEALKEIVSLNRLRNDLDAYLFTLANWGLGKEEKRPVPKDFGL